MTKKTVSKIIFGSIICSALVSCQQFIGASQTNEQGLVPLVPIETPNPDFRYGDDKHELIKDEGWGLPSLSSFDGTDRKELFIKTGETKIRLGMTEYRPAKDVVVTANGNTYQNIEPAADVADKSWIVRSIKVFDIKKKPFCYFIRGDLVSTDTDGRIVGFIATTIALVYYDKNGDGTFEAFRYRSPFPEVRPIPSWVEAESARK